MSSLICSVVLLHSVFMALLGINSSGAGGSRQGLFVLSCLLGFLAVVAVRLVNKLSPLTLWLACGVIVPVVIYGTKYNWLGV
jgi:hypothetical protein